MDLTLELFFDHEWHHVGTLELVDEVVGYLGATSLEYDDQYFLDHGAIPFADDRPLRDVRALSVNIPLDLVTRKLPRWPAFFLDLLPQGHQRERIAAHLGLPANARSSDIQLLLHGAGSPVGNLRIKEAREKELERVSSLPRAGVTMDQILDRTDSFLSVADTFAMLASGSSGLQGNWPKIAMTKARDGLWYPDSTVSDADAVEFGIVKFTRSNDPIDEAILRAEAAYSEIALEFGLNVHKPSTYGSGVLFVPRFDRAIVDKKVIRYGQESFVSALGVAEFEHIDKHENYLSMLRDASSNPIEDVIEYVTRDVLNLAMGNPDNHGRNTALQKRGDGSIRVSPLFDFAPMRLSSAAIVRSTKWECMRTDGRDYNPDWNVVCEVAAGDRFDANAIKEKIISKETLLRRLPDLGKKHGLQPEVIERAFAASTEIASSVSKIKCT